MANKKLNWKSVLELIKNGKSTKNITIEFNDKKILWKDAMILGENNFEIPDEHIFYDDENIDYSDIPEITEEDIKTGKIKWIYKAEIPMRQEINDWIKHEKIDINNLLTDLVENFYQSVKKIHENAAL